MPLARVALIAFSLLTASACGGSDEGPEPTPEDPHKALLPTVCRMPRDEAACEACVAGCCAPCAPGSACIRFRACMQSCGGSIPCIEDCGDSHPEGERAAVEAELCIDADCADTC